jgi:hypothetical protein
MEIADQTASIGGESSVLQNVGFSTSIPLLMSWPHVGHTIVLVLRYSLILG